MQLKKTFIKFEYYKIQFHIFRKILIFSNFLNLMPDLVL